MTAPALDQSDRANFMSATAAPLGGNSPWAQRIGAEVRQIAHAHAAQAPRTLQRHLGPSELGVRCDRQVVGKMAGLPNTNHVADPWPSIRGTALHAHFEKIMAWENERLGTTRWFPERKVQPFVTPGGHGPGTSDLYDCWECAVLDWKFLGPTSMAKIRKLEGPPIHYVIQLLLYGLGYRRLGYRVDRVAIVAVPAADSSMDGVYVWERPYSVADDELIAEVWSRTEYRQGWARALAEGRVRLRDVPAFPTDDDCYFCPFYRPQSAREGSAGVGCPGTLMNR